MARWLYLGAALVGLVLLGGLLGSPALHSPGDADCSALDDGTNGSALEGATVGQDGPDDIRDCPVDDAAAMGGSSAGDE